MSNKKTSKIWIKETNILGILAIFSVLTIGSIVALESAKEQSDLPGLWQSILISILTSLVASFIFIMIQKAFFREDNKELDRQLGEIEQRLKLQSELYDSGILSIHPKAYFDNEDDFWRTIINNTENRLELIGHSISNWFKPEYRECFCNKIVEMAKNGKEIRIILSSDQFDLDMIWKVYSDREKKKTLNKTEKTVLTFLQLMKRIPEEHRKYLKIYWMNRKDVSYMYIRTDDRCIISPYINFGTSQNSFLLELQTGTAYTKAFEESFREVIEKEDGLDLTEHHNKSQMENGMKLSQTIMATNYYSGRDWNFEKTTKYVFEEDDMKYEAGYFEHYRDNEFVKSVIELPVSYGCPSKCQFCASSMIDRFCPMDAKQMMALFQYIYENNGLEQKEYVLVAMTGMGDLYYNWKEELKFLQKLKDYKNVAVTVSSCLWDKELLRKFDQLSAILPIRNIQLTYVSSRMDVLERVIPIYRNKPFRLEEALDHIRQSDKDYYRINYILVQGINDSVEDFNHFRNMLSDVKNKVTVRISKLNETGATKINGLCPVDIAVMKKYKDLLIASGIRCYVFYSKTNDNMNCGQLITEKV